MQYSIARLCTWRSFFPVVLASLALPGCGGSDAPAVIVLHDDGGPPDVAVDVGVEVAIDSGVDPSAAPRCEGTPGGGASPPARSDAAGALDATGKRLLVFGGDTDATSCGGVASPAHASDTWVLDVGCGSWKQVDGGGPAARARHTIAEDRTATGSGRAWLFGGRTRAAGSTASFTLLDDVWSFDFATSSWSEVATTGNKPSARYDSATVVSATRGKLYVVGGNVATTGTTATPRGDTYALDLATKVWVGVGDPTKRPPARLQHAIALDDEAGVLYAFSGADSRGLDGPFLEDLWALDLATETWTAVTPTGDAPRPRVAHRLVFDRITQKLVLFGGHDDGDVGNENDVWTIDPRTTTPSWSRLPGGDVLHTKSTAACTFASDFTTIDKLSPERRRAFVFGARADGHAFVVYGGRSDCGLVADAWWFSGGAAAWTQMVKSPIGLSCLRYSSTCSTLCG